MRNTVNITNLSVSSFDQELAQDYNPNFYYRTNLYNELLKRSVDDKLISSIYKSLLKSLIKIFSEISYRNDEEEIKHLPCWHGSSERVIAKIKQESNIILPVASVSRVTDEIDDDRRRIDSLLMFEKYFDKRTNRAVRVASLASVPTVITYTLNLWTKYYEDMDQISEQVKRLFNPTLRIPNDYSDQTIGFLNRENSDITLSLQDGKDRVIRRSYDISVDSYIPNPKFLVTHTGKIEELNLEYCFPL